RAAGKRRVLRIRRLVRGATAGGVDGDPRQEARQRRGDRRGLRRRVRRRLPHADARRPLATWLARARAPPGRGAGGAGVSEPDLARRIVLDIARRTGARMAVKSKSMATEEIHLNDALEAAGVTPVETDLGEYIIQLAHERPSHIIAPAIHKTKGQVAELFRRELNRDAAPDPEVLTQIARAELRQKFLQADLGITGANFGVAETGTVVLVTNEGNGRMVTSLPRVHVAVMGVEKVIPSMTDLAVFLAILARSATGQKLSVYTSLLNGPRRAGELAGPEEFHLVLLDNGRIRQIAGPLREALSCL